MAYPALMTFASFLSTPSARRATRHRSGRTEQREYFYPRPPRGGRPTTSMTERPSSSFLSTPSARRATGEGKREGG